MAPPYRKACYSCAKGKRRCDLGSPKCQRCTRNGLVCDYKGKSSGTGGLISLDNPTADTATVEAEPALETMVNLLQLPFDGNHSPALVTDTLSIAQLPSWPPPNTFADDALEFLEVGIRTNPISPIDNTAWFHTSAAADIDMEAVHDIDAIAIEPGDSFHIIGETYQARVQYGLRLFQCFPGLFVTTGQNPFIHRQLYREVKSDAIQDALSCCSLYMVKNEHNESLVFDDITRKSKNVINCRQPFQSPVEHLAAVQALLLYQIIRLFDGNVRLRAEAEKDLDVLERWTEQLPKIQPIAPDTFSQPDLVIQTSKVCCWNDWIFEESERRTILTSYLLMGVYSFLKDGHDRFYEKIHQLSFTGQVAIWEAPSYFHWKIAFRDKNRLQLRVSDWDEVMTEAQPDDLDVLGVMIMVAFKDLDYTSGWLGTENFKKYQLDPESLHRYHF